jgi:outer membrane lipoprotein
MRYFSIAIALLFVLSGCASIMSKGALTGVDRAITVPMVQSDPARFADARVLWGGIIISSKNLKGSTVIEVFETGLTVSDLPRDISNEPGSSGGRFLIVSPGYLDTLVYKPEMMITVVGALKGIRNEKIGEMSYPYPALAPLEMRLSEPVQTYEGYPYYDPYYYDPLYDPWFDRYPAPYYGPYPNNRWPRPHHYGY